MTTPKAQREAEKLWEIENAIRNAVFETWGDMLLNEGPVLAQAALAAIKQGRTEPLEQCSQDEALVAYSREYIRTVRALEQRSQAYPGRPEGGEE